MIIDGENVSSVTVVPLVTRGGVYCCAIQLSVQYVGVHCV